MSYIVFDAETTIRCPVGNFTANPMWDGNEVVMFGWKADDETTVNINESKYAKLSLINLAKNEDIFDLYVGHNIKFDLLYAYKAYEKEHGKEKTIELFSNAPEIWDTQLAEYLLTGQQTMYASLDECAAKYGGTLKDSFVTDCFKAGIPTEDIDKTKLQAYLEQDVRNTEIVFKAQILEAQKLGMLDFIKTQMKALMATILMNYHGIKIDLDYIEHQSETLDKVIKDNESTFNLLVLGLRSRGLLPDIPFSIASTKDLSGILFGGKYKEKQKIEDGKYKNGNVRYKTVEVEKTYPGLFQPTFSVPKNKNGYYPVDITMLNNITTGGTSSIAMSIATIVLAYREASKQRETYYENLKKLHIFGYVYPKINHTNTKTGRLSCTEPNLQNQTTDGGVKKAFVSRFENGRLVELDYSQLEMVALAVLSGDRKMLQDIRDGVDMHSELYKEMYGKYPTKEERKPFKALSFGLVYGAGYKSLAANAGCSEDDAKKFIKVFYNRYVGVKAYHDELVTVARSLRKPTTMRDAESGLPLGEFVLKSKTGRMYRFREYANKKLWGPDKGKWETSFSPPELKNWPIQGFATGDIVPMMVGILSEILYKTYKGNVLPIMTVHDSILIDINCDKLEVDIFEVVAHAKNILESADFYVKKLLGTDFPLKLKVEATEGTNWLEQTQIVF